MQQLEYEQGDESGIYCYALRHRGTDTKLDSGETVRMRRRTAGNANHMQETTNKTRADKKGNSLRIVYEVPQKIPTSQKGTLIVKASGLGLLIRSKRGALRAMGWRSVPGSPFKRSVRFLRGQKSMDAMRISL